MSDKTITNKKRSIKAIYSSIRNRLKENWWVAYIALAFTIIIIIGNRKTEKSYKDSILYEINYARHMLAYTLLLRQQNIRALPTFSLKHLNHVPESFSDNFSLKSDLTDLYQSFFSAKRSAEDLMFLLPQNNSDPLTITNREKDIEKAINMADKIGPQIAKYIGNTWQIPDPNLSQQEKIKYYENKTSVLNSISTDTNINSLWHKDK